MNANHHPDLTCRICGNSEGNSTWIAREMMYGLRDEFLYFQCAACNCLQIADLQLDLTKYYPAHYYSFQPYDGKKFKGLKGRFKRFQYRSAIFRAGLMARLCNLVLDVPDYRIFKGLGIHRGSRILDVGCGNGRSFLYPLAETGFGNAMGCDPFLDDNIVYPNGLKIERAAVQEIGGQWDVITYHHSFEHVPDPQAQLDQVASLLAPDGVCIIRIPTASSWAWEHYRTNWAQLDAPRHLFLHSRESMELMAGRAGLELYDIVFDSRHFQFSGSEKYLADTPLATPRKKGPLRFLRRKIKKMEYIRRAKQLNREGRGDQAAFFFRRVEIPS